MYCICICTVSVYVLYLYMYCICICTVSVYVLYLYMYCICISESPLWLNHVYTHCHCMTNCLIITCCYSFSLSLNWSTWSVKRYGWLIDWRLKLNLSNLSTAYHFSMPVLRSTWDSARRWHRNTNHCNMLPKCISHMHVCSTNISTRPALFSSP